MATKVRKQIYIDPSQEVRLKQLASLTGLSEAELIRQGIDLRTRRFYDVRPDIDAWEAERRYITNLIQQGPVAGGRTWQRDELYAREDSG